MIRLIQMFRELWRISRGIEKLKHAAQYIARDIRPEPDTLYLLKTLRQELENEYTLREQYYVWRRDVRD